MFLVTEMGIVQLFQVLSKKGLLPVAADLTEIGSNTEIDVDLLGSPLFRNYVIGRIVRREINRPRPQGNVGGDVGGGGESSSSASTLGFRAPVFHFPGQGDVAVGQSSSSAGGQSSSRADPSSFRASLFHFPGQGEADGRGEQSSNSAGPSSFGAGQGDAGGGGEQSSSSAGPLSLGTSQGDADGGEQSSSSAGPLSLGAGQGDAGGGGEQSSSSAGPLSLGAGQGDADGAGAGVVNYIKSLLGDGNSTITIHIDGARNTEKDYAHAARKTKYDKNLLELKTQLAAMERRAGANKRTCQTAMNKIEALLKQVFTLRPRQPADGNERIVVTGDSDLLGYRSVERVLRVVPRTGIFAWYDKADVLAKLELPSSSHLTVLAAISKNDYGPNIKTLGIITNCKIIKKIAAGPIDSMLDEYVQLATVKVGHPVDKAMFDSSKRIFFDMQDTMSTSSAEAASNNDFVTQVREFNRIKGIRATVSRQAQADRPGISFYVRRGSKRNQFRHIFSSKGSILHKTKEVDLSLVRAYHHPPAPSKGPATKRRKRALKKKQKKQKKIPKKTKPKDQPAERTLQSSTREDHRLRKTFVTKALKVGCIHGNLVRTRTTSGITAAEAKTISTSLLDAVMIINKIQRFAYEVIALDIATIVSAAAARAVPPLAAQASSSSASQTTSAPLSRLSNNEQKDLTCKTFWRTTHFTIPWPRFSAQGALDPSPVPHVVQAYNRYQGATGYQPFFRRQAAQRGQELVSNTAGPVFPATVPALALHAVMAAIKSHYLGSDFGDMECPEGVHPIDFFFQANAKDRQCADFPKAKLAPGYVFLSEASLVQILYSNNETKGIISRVMGHATSKAAGEHVVRTKGWLIRQLFYNTASTKRFDGYHRKVRLQSEGNRGGKFKLRGTICTNAGFKLHCTQQPGPGGDDDDTEADAEDSDLFNIENQIEGDFLLEDAFFPGAGGSSQGSSQGSSPSASEDEWGDFGDDDDDDGDDGWGAVELGGSMSTSAQAGPSAGPSTAVGQGTLVSPSAVVLGKRRATSPPPQTPTAVARGKRKATSPTPQTSGLLPAGPLPLGPQTRSAVAAGKRRATSSAPQSTATTAVTATPFAPGDINWLRSSRILQNVGVLYTNPGNSPNPDLTTVIGIEPGEVNTMTATRIGPMSSATTSTAEGPSTSTASATASWHGLDSPLRASVVVRRSFLYKPYTMFRGLLQQRKAAQGIDIIESKIPSMTIEGIHLYLNYFKNGVQEALFDFYLSPWYLRKSWDMRKAQLAAYDYAIKAIMGLAGQQSVNEGQRRPANGADVVFAIGLGSFNTQTGLPSKHGELERRFIIRVKSLGYDVVGIHEYYTSAKCPRQGCNAFLEQVKKTRTKYCRNCQAFMDRDKVGSENIATICRAHIRHQTRPDKYMPASNN
ncbi:hypothetical protein BGZ67_010310 [Mortierella alpina]|nr:hypothetical protein BGZ67_010310 [Mortierella alpina]